MRRRYVERTVLDEVLSQELAGAKLAAGAGWLVSKPDGMRAQAVHLQAAYTLCQYPNKKKPTHSLFALGAGAM